MRYRKLDANGDYTIGTGADFYINQPEAVQQAVLTALRLYTGEWFLDLTDGTPWRTEVLGKYTQDTYDTVIKQRILSVTGVSSIAAYSSSLNTSTRVLSITVTLNTIYGQVIVQGPL
jgi:hypothetical protein